MWFCRFFTTLSVTLLSSCSVFGFSSAEIQKASNQETASIEIVRLPQFNTNHHSDNGFINPWPSTYEHPSFFKRTSWMLSRIFSSPDVGDPAPYQKIDETQLTTPKTGYRITWLGHASMLIQTQSINILADPVFSERVSPVTFAGPKRRIPLPIDPIQLPKISLVVISHNHYDHLDKSSLLFLKERDNPLFIVPFKNKKLLLSFGITRVIELDWYEQINQKNITITCTPARHFSARSLTDRDETLWASYVIDVNDLKSYRFYFGGDTAYSPHFSQIGHRFTNIDVAMLPIGAYNPRWLMQKVHVDPEQSVQAFIDLKAKNFIGMHWGTYELADEPLQEPPNRAQKSATEHNINSAHFFILPVGGQINIILDQ
ncbi:MAG: MBL fold metallo-hydrolase [Leptonema sp. (in: Bacteria)]|nr:MBL fold metallo-hydrolase [Leptonema sp. (in: bacteria)]